MKGRNETIACKVTAAERDTLKAQAARRGCTVSELIYERAVKREEKDAETEEE